MCLTMVLFEFTLFWSSFKLLKSQSLCILPYLGDFQPFFQIFFHLHSLCPLLLGHHLSICWSFWNYFLVSLGAVHFSPNILPLLYIIQLQVTLFFLCPLSSIEHFKNFNYCMFSVVIHFFLSLLILSAFHLLQPSFTECGYVVALKFMSADSTILTSSRPASVGFENVSHFPGSS